MDFQRITPEEMEKIYKEMKESLDSANQQISNLEAQIKLYQDRIKLFTRDQFGKKSEKHIDDNQLSLFDEIEIEQTPIKVEPPVETVISRKGRKKKGKRENDFSRLERVIVDHTLENPVCPKCNTPMRQVGYTKRCEIRYYPGKFKVIEHRQYSYTCSARCDEEKATFNKAKLPPVLIQQSVLTPSLFALIIHNKFSLSLPLYRQERDFDQNELTLSRQTMANWCIKIYDTYLYRLQERMHELILQMDVIGADETTIRVLTENGDKVSNKSWMWIFKSGKYEEKQIILYKYRASRAHIHGIELLEGFRGICLSDGYQAYEKVPDITNAGCMAHLRRKIYDSYSLIEDEEAAKSSFSNSLLNLIKQLFAIEEEAVKQKLSVDQITELRQKEAKPIFNTMMKAINERKEQPMTDRLKTAITYAINQEKKLRTYLNDGRIEISNNALERCAKAFAVGRGNWKFAATNRGADASSCYYSIVETAKSNNLKPRQYLEYLFTHIIDMNLYDNDALDAIAPWSKTLPKELYKPEKA